MGMAGAHVNPGGAGTVRMPLHAELLEADWNIRARSGL